MNKIVALVGNPNSGKTTLFNALTGLRQKVGNYPGITVERKEGFLTLPDGVTATLIDLPGLYSLTPQSPDEQITRDILLGYRTDTARPEVIISVVDASNLERNLYLASQLADLGLPLVVALTMGDTAARRGVEVDADALSQELGFPVVPIHAASRAGLSELRAMLAKPLPVPPVRRWLLPESVEEEAKELAELLTTEHDLAPETAFSEAVLLLGAPSTPKTTRWSPEILSHLHGDHERLTREGHDTATAVAEARYGEINRIVQRAVRRAESPPTTITERLDRLFLHKFWGYAIFLGILAVLFQAMFTWAEIPKGWLESAIVALSHGIQAVMPEGSLRDLLTEGILSGVGTTITFLPQILLLFLFIMILEDTGYLARAAFLMDRLMSRVGLHGKSFIPLLSSYACAIPGILATRTIESHKARLLTILVAPLMSCSARLPVYSLLIAAFIPKTTLIGFHIGTRSFALLTLQGATLFSMYALGTLATFLMAALFHKTLLRGEAPAFLLELPPYRKPIWRTLGFRLGETALQFVQRAGTVILALSTLLWFLASYPKAAPEIPKSVALENSYAGKLGHVIEPLIAPLGFDWKMGVGVVASFAAREVFVSTMAILYQAESDDEEEQAKALKDRLSEEKRPDGSPAYTPLVAICLMVFYVLAMQCISTLAVVKRETNSWKWPLFQLAYMTFLAWFITFIVQLIGKALGY
ncbi:ferrous iron transport protein B [Armatimonas sp.]|uniref:ferrous iron transport protein B n=2 Tax=Armatimonas sp. TaxID=1872638 RepID=UPI00374D7C48